MAFWAHWPAPLEAFTAWQARPFERALARAVAAHRPNLVVSTYNLASQCLGRLVSRGEIDVPVATFVTDPGAHPYWVSPQVRRHLVITDSTADALRRLRARGVTVVARVLRPEFDTPPSRQQARSTLGLPESQRVVVLNAGSWGAGRPARTLRVIRRVPGLSVVALCGRDERLHAEFAGLPSVRAVPWTPEVSNYLAAADVVVDNAGGQTCWGALACRTPVLTYLPLPGHGRLNAAALDRAGLARWVRSPRALVAALARVPSAADQPPAPIDRGPQGDAVAALLEQLEVMP
jgi:UDP-N-acetylglucosamine:LPS N-acetylglucosamine transferase